MRIKVFLSYIYHALKLACSGYQAERSLRKFGGIWITASGGAKIKWAWESSSCVCA